MLSEYLGSRNYLFLAPPLHAPFHPAQRARAHHSAPASVRLPVADLHHEGKINVQSEQVLSGADARRVTANLLDLIRGHTD